jgi:hypothetical protein
VKTISCEAAKVKVKVMQGETKKRTRYASKTNSHRARLRSGRVAKMRSEGEKSEFVAVK